MSRKEIFEDIEIERLRQDVKWGGPEHRDQHDYHDWFELILNFYQLYRICTSDIERSILIQIATLAVAAIESLDRKNEEKEV